MDHWRKWEKTQQSPTSQPQQPPHPQINIPNSVRQPLEHIDEIMAILKTAYPLMALSLESLVDQINKDSSVLQTKMRIGYVLHCLMTVFSI